MVLDKLRPLEVIFGDNERSHNNSVTRRLEFQDFHRITMTVCPCSILLAVLGVWGHYLFVADILGAQRHWRLHRHQRQDLQQVYRTNNTTMYRVRTKALAKEIKHVIATQDVEITRKTLLTGI